MDEIQAHLPEEPNSFIGRERELDELRRFMLSMRAVTLCGPGGIGKTRAVTCPRPASWTCWRETPADSNSRMS